MDRCPICPRKYNPVPGSGPQPAAIMGIGERPGRDENRYGRPFIGMAGQELDETYLPLAGLDRADIYVSNCVKCLYHNVLVVLADGTTKRINQIVKERYSGRVVSVAPNGMLSSSKVIGWYRSCLAARPLFRLRFEGYRAKGCRDCGGTVLTGDHLVLTSAGWVSVEKADGAPICTGVPGLSRRQLAATLGMLLGDAWIGKNGPALACCHGYKQSLYAAHKKRMLSNFGMTRFREQRTDIVGFQTTWNPTWRYLATKIDKRQIYDWDFITANFDWSTLAIWFMDDGCLRHPRHPSSRRDSEICAVGRADDVDRLAKLVHEKFDLAVTCRRGRLCFGVDATETIMARCGAWFTPDLRYKLLPTAPTFDPSLYDPDNEPFFARAFVEPFRGPRAKSVYCIQTEHGNFATMGGVVHNCFAENNRTPTDKEIAGCGKHFLPDEIRETNPEVILLLGASACSLVPGVRLDMHHGIPRRAELFGWSGWVVPLFHPAIGLHEGKFMTPLLEDWEMLGRILRGEI
jgi:uracil-DNA glycosylase